jgi:hypothetical protein
MGKGFLEVVEDSDGGKPHLHGENVCDLLKPTQIDAILNTPAGRKLVRDRLLRLCGEVFREVFANKAGEIIDPLTNDAVVRECRRALSDGWKSDKGVDTVERVVRRMVEEKVSRAIADGYEVRVMVSLIEKHGGA